MNIDTSDYFEFREENAILRDKQYNFFVCDESNKKRRDFHVIIGSYTFYGATSSILPHINLVFHRLKLPLLDDSQYNLLIRKMKNHKSEHGVWAKGIKPKPLDFEDKYELSLDQILKIQEEEAMAKKLNHLKVDKTI